MGFKLRSLGIRWFRAHGCRDWGVELRRFKSLRFGGCDFEVEGYEYTAIPDFAPTRTCVFPNIVLISIVYIDTCMYACSFLFVCIYARM